MPADVPPLAVYRVLIGQPRQEELLAWLASREAAGEGGDLRPEDLVMDLSPPLIADSVAAGEA